jgi:hypothetical protein
MLVVAILIIAASVILRVEEDQVGLLGTTDFFLPPLCLSRAWFGIECPGCGLTRSFVHLFHGNWEAAFAAHRLGWLLAGLLLLQIPYRIASLKFPSKEWIPERPRRWIANGLIFLLVVNWLLKS